MILAKAPGKVVLLGEYAVLAGAPAVVLAVNRHAVCKLAPNTEFRFTAKGFRAPIEAFERLPSQPPQNQPAAMLAWHILNVLGWRRTNPVALRLDTGAFYHQGGKLGLGSSAALCVAIQGACAQFIGEPPSFDQALQAHRQFQDGQGSGIDVAAGFYGGVLRYQDGRATPLAASLPQCQFLWTGESANTKQHLDRFKNYLQRSDNSALDDLAAGAEHLCELLDLDRLSAYVRALKRLDQVAALGIYTSSHRRAEQLAHRYNLVYKPCGAGGGDIGAAFAESPSGLAEFQAAATAAEFTLLHLEIAGDGVEVHP